MEGETLMEQVARVANNEEKSTEIPTTTTATTSSTILSTESLMTSFSLTNDQQINYIGVGMNETIITDDDLNFSLGFNENNRQLTSSVGGGGGGADSLIPNDTIDFQFRTPNSPKRYMKSTNSNKIDDDNCLGLHSSDIMSMGEGSSVAEESVNLNDSSIFGFEDDDDSDEEGVSGNGNGIVNLGDSGGLLASMNANKILSDENCAYGGGSAGGGGGMGAGGVSCDGGGGDSGAESETTIESPSKAAMEDRKLMALISHFSEDQWNRYESYKRTSFQKPAVKRLMQSISKCPITTNVAIAMAGITKVFIGEIVEEAVLFRDRVGDTGPLQPKHIQEAMRIIHHRGTASRLRKRHHGALM